jgi:hypothetical protein
MGTLFHQTPSREGSTIMENKNIVERSNVKQPSFGKGPTKLVSTSPSQSEGKQQIEK